MPDNPANDRFPQLAFMAYAWCAFLAVGLPALIASVVLKDQRSRRRVAYGAARLLAKATGTSISVTGKEKLLQDKPYVLVSNHDSYIDSFVLAAILPPKVSFLAGEAIAEQAIAGFFLRRIGVLFLQPKDHNGLPTGARGQIEKLADIVKNGTSLVFYPEGGLSKQPGLRRFRHGAFVVARQANCPVVPVGISGTREMVPPGTRSIRSGRIYVCIGDPIYPEGNDWRSTVDFSRRAQQAVSEMKALAEHLSGAAGKPGG
jgi:1-acyl-sn-glycerol-3-phosphate acyltransferase